MFWKVSPFRTGGSPTSDAPEVTENGMFPLLDPSELSKLGSRNMEVATRAARAYFNGATKLNQEMMGFISNRMKKDMETTQTIMTSKTSEQAFHCQAEFVEGAIRDYAEEASKLLNLAADMAHETLLPVEARTEEVLHSIDERAVNADAAE